MKNLLSAVVLCLFLSNSQKIFSQTMDSTEAITTDSLREGTQDTVLSSVIGKTITDPNPDQSRHHHIIIFIDGKNPIDYLYEHHPNVIYAGFIIDFNTEHFNKGGFGFYTGYKRYLPFDNSWGLNGIFSFSYLPLRFVTILGIGITFISFFMIVFYLF